jgi:hypothetical protein
VETVSDFLNGYLFSCNFINAKEHVSESSLSYLFYKSVSCCFSLLRILSDQISMCQNVGILEQLVFVYTGRIYTAINIDKLFIHNFHL